MAQKIYSIRSEYLPKAPTIDSIDNATRLNKITRYCSINQWIREHFDAERF